MRLRLWAVRLTCATAIAAILLPAPARASSSPDRKATHAYISARHRMFSALRGSLSSWAPLIHEYVQTVASECPGVLSAAPKNEQLLDFLQEELDALAVVLAPRMVSQVRTFIRSVADLRWSDRGLTRGVRAEARERPSEVRMPMPHLCADYRAWAASGYSVVPAETKRLAAEAEKPSRWAPSELGSINQGLWDRLARYETRSLKTLARETQKLEEQFAVVFVSLALGTSRELRERLGMSDPNPLSGQSENGSREAVYVSRRRDPNP